MKLYIAKVVIFVDDRVCERGNLELVSLLNDKVKIDAKYLEQEFGIYVRPIWASVQDNSDVLTEENKKNIEKMFEQD